MILPIHVYGDSVLREPAEPVETDSPELQQLIDDMVATMRGAEGIGLAAPQIGRSLRFFVADLSVFFEEDEDPDEEMAAWPEMPMAFINPEIVAESEELCDYEEGCLSIPDLRETVVRPERVQVNYLDRNFKPHSMEADGLLARVIQHELDHLDGVLFIDYISSFKRRLMQRRLKEMARGEIEADYPLASPAGA